MGKKIKKPSKKKQGEKKGLSLRKLTPEFKKLVMKQDNHILNINTAQSVLNIQKRRIYDMTNSLEALNYL